MARQISDGVWHLSLMGVNGYIVDDGDVYLVDAGTPWDASAVIEGIEDAGYSTDDVDGILVTHYDFDHVGGLAKVADEVDATVYVGDPDAGYLTGRDKPPMSNHKGAFQRAVGFLIRSPDADVLRVEGGDSVGGFTAYHTPGHTPGHMAYVHDSLGVGVLGDLVASDDGGFKILNRLLNYDTNEVKESVRGLAESAEFELGCVGHGSPVESRASDELGRLSSELS